MRNIILCLVLFSVSATLNASPPVQLGTGGAQSMGVKYPGHERRKDLYPPDSVKKGDQYPCGSNLDGTTEMCTR